MPFSQRRREPARAPWSLLAFALLNIPSAARVLEARAAATPGPLAISSTQSWDGNDGPWSSFPLSVGNPPQLLKVLPATSSSQTWVVATEGCGSGDPQSCKEDRGSLWDRSASKTYVVNTANSTTDIYSLDLHSNLNFRKDNKGRYGFDTVQLGWNRDGVELANQTVVGIATKDYFMGMFGLDPRPTNYTGYAKSVPSFLSALKSNSSIPSLSWAYTAGNQYRSTKGIPGSLTLGGYDRSKFTANNIDFAIADDERDLMTSIQKITTNSGQTTLLPSPITAYLDSAVSFIYLPVEACQLFEKEFQLTWNETEQMYIVSDVTHTFLLAKNPSVTFNLGTATESVDITFPYAAFDLVATYVYDLAADTKVNYFPLRRANDSSQYTLGRTFFQEAYVIADYERRNFSISQASFNERAEEDLVAIYPVGDSPSTSTTPVGAIAGGVAGGVAIIALVALYFFWWRPRQRRKKTVELDSTAVNPLYHPLHPNSHHKDPNFVKAELDAGDDHLAAAAHDGRYGKPAEVSGQQEIYEMDGGDAVHEMHEGSRDDKRGSWFFGKDRKRQSGVPSRQDTTDTFGFPKTPSSAHPGLSGESSIQSTPAVNYAVPSPRRYDEMPPAPYRDRTPSPRIEGQPRRPLRNTSAADGSRYPTSPSGSIAISSAGNSLRHPPGSPDARGAIGESPIISPSSAVDRGQFRRF